MKNHFRRKNPCKIKHKNVPIHECLFNLEGGLILNNCLNDTVPLNDLRSSALEMRSGALEIRSGALEMRSGALETKEYPKNIPKISQKYICHKCDKAFKQKRYLNQHISRYKCDIMDFEDTTQDLITKKELNAKLAAKDNVIDELRTQIQLLLNKVGSNTYNNTYNIVNINPFGKEDTSYINEQIINDLITDGPLTSIPKLLKYIHFNPEHKENHNIKIPNKKQPYAQIFNGQDWIYRDKSETIDTMSNKAFGLLNKHYFGGNEYMDEFKDNFDNKPGFLCRRLTKDVELLIINSQKIIDKEKTPNASRV
tara:strand:- start:917 stop:1846 length:930 start_codon:yes stop_codon:yes gene_type:complete